MRASKGWVTETHDVVMDKRATTDQKSRDAQSAFIGGAVLDRSVDGRALKVVGFVDSYCACALGNVKVGDCLVALNQRPLLDATTDEMPLLPKLSKQCAGLRLPITLTFERQVARRTSLMNAFASNQSVAEAKAPRELMVLFQGADKLSGWAALGLEVKMKGGYVTVEKTAAYKPAHAAGLRQGDKVLASGAGRALGDHPTISFADSIGALTWYRPGTLSVKDLKHALLRLERPVMLVVERQQGHGDEHGAHERGAKFSPGDEVCWKGSDEDVPSGTVGVVVEQHEDGDVEVSFPKQAKHGSKPLSAKGGAVKGQEGERLHFTFRVERLEFAPGFEEAKKKKAETGGGGLGPGSGLASVPEEATGGGGALGKLAKLVQGGDRKSTMSVDRTPLLKGQDENAKVERGCPCIKRRGWGA